MERESVLDIAKRIWSEDLRRREQQHVKAMQNLAAQVAAKGIGLSGAHLYLAQEVCVTEIRLRAEMVRNVVARVADRIGFTHDARELRHLFSQTILSMYVDVDRTFNDVLHSVIQDLNKQNEHQRNLGHEQVEALKQQEAELDLLAATKRSVAGGSVVVNAPVYGAIQTGAASSADITVNINPAGMQAVREAVQALREALRTSEDIPSSASAVLSELEAETISPAPRPRRIAALLASTASLVDISANAPQAYDTLKGAAALIGVHLP